MPKLVCTACGQSFDTKPIVYGLPDAETSAAAERGDVVLAGCDPGDPVTLGCPRCGAPNEWASGWASAGRAGA